MLIIAEELMLLALDDEKGSVVFSASGSLPYGLAGAMLLDLYFLNKIDITRCGNTNDCVISIDSAPTKFAYLDELYAAINSPGKDIRHWINKLSGNIDNYKEKIFDNLVGKGILRHEAQKAFWLMKLVRYPTENTEPELKIRYEIRDIIINRKVPDAKLLALINLVKSCELVHEVFTPDEIKSASGWLDTLTEAAYDKPVLAEPLSKVCFAVSTAVTADKVSKMMESNLFGIDQPPAHIDKKGI